MNKGFLLKNVEVGPAVLRILGPFPESHDIEKLFTRNPDFHKINWFRQKQWKEKQDKA
ncbi:hypothetical protein HQ584_02275 [Patescibacteria group bacterium]|nr:hypothetical protein [Patescibacteria group bacterium]